MVLNLLIIHAAWSFHRNFCRIYFHLTVLSFYIQWCYVIACIHHKFSTIIVNNFELKNLTVWAKSFSTCLLLVLPRFSVIKHSSILQKTNNIFICRWVENIIWINNEQELPKDRTLWDTNFNISEFTKYIFDFYGLYPIAYLTFH